MKVERTLEAAAKTSKFCCVTLATHLLLCHSQPDHDGITRAVFESPVVTHVCTSSFSSPSPSAAPLLETNFGTASAITFSICKTAALIEARLKHA